MSISVTFASFIGKKNWIICFRNFRYVSTLVGYVAISLHKCIGSVKSINIIKIFNVYSNDRFKSLYFYCNSRSLHTFILVALFFCRFTLGCIVYNNVRPHVAENLLWIATIEANAIKKIYKSSYT